MHKILSSFVIVIARYEAISRFLFLSLFFALLLFSQNTFSQPAKTQIKIVKANSLQYDKIVNVDATRLIGDVQFNHEGADMFCDSAYFYESSNSLDAFGSVRIIKGDSLKLSGSLLKYDGNASIARMYKNVRMTDSQMTLTTDSITYDRNNEIAYYTNGAKIVDKENTLTSKRGYYYAAEKMLYFRERVVMKNPKYDLYSDTLKYQTVLKTAYFLGPTNIFSKGTDSTKIYCEFGWYNTISEHSYFSKNAWIQSKQNKLSGDSILYDKKAGLGEVFNNVTLNDTTQKILITGNRAKYFEKQNYSYVSGRATLVQILEKDSMFMAADTLFAITDSSEKQRAYSAYHHVKIFKSDLQAKCDSLYYAASDSMMRMFGNPVMWSDKNQLTADTINVQMANNKIDKLYLYNTAFITSQEDTLRYNQIKGKLMTGFFEDNKLRRIKVEGNGQTIYYGRNSKKQLVGVNRAECSDMMIAVDSNQVKRITLIKQPDATFYPIKELDPNELLLKDFLWRDIERPIKKEDIYFREK